MSFEPYHSGHDVMIEQLEDDSELQGITSQYSVVRKKTANGYCWEIIKPDGSYLIDVRHAFIAYVICDELNSLLVLPFDHESQIEDLPF